ncbi:MAG TPA: ribosome maturation factor RimM [Polyangiaceae bacterium]|jgi:16S rRNA processing protein RimM|nr:ribosome maturation factor RimM [Polyangiaceae bacterium]
MASDSLSKPETLEVGRVSKAHGIIGELRVTPHYEASDSLARAQEIWLDLKGSSVLYQVERARAVPRAFLVKLRGVDDRNAAEALHGATVSVAREVLPALEPGEYYLVDLVGARVVGPDGDVGEVTSVVSHPTVDVIVLKLADGRTAEQALSLPWLAEVDVAARRVVLSSLDGLM